MMIPVDKEKKEKKTNKIFKQLNIHNSLTMWAEYVAQKKQV